MKFGVRIMSVDFVIFFFLENVVFFNDLNVLSDK